MPKRSKYSTEFKREAVELCDRTGKTTTEVAKELGIRQQTLSRWRQEILAIKSPPRPRSTKSNEALEMENAELRRELDRVSQERDFLKKAAAFFAKESK